MILVWLLAAVVLVVGAILIGVQVGQISRLAGDVEVELAEAAEALAVVGGYRTDLDDASARIEGVVTAVGSPLALMSQARRTTRHWWSRARRAAPGAHVASRP